MKSVSISDTPSRTTGATAQRTGDERVQTITTSVGPIQYYDTGSGPALLFVHGLFTNMHLWRKIIPELSRHFRCIVPTLPFGGHSLPVRDDVDLSPPALAALIFELIETLQPGEVTIVANDTGGALTQLALASRPDHPAIRGVVFTNCDAFEVFPPRRFVYLRWIAHLPVIPTLLAYQMRLDVIRRLPIAMGGLTRYRIPSDVLDLYLRPFVTDRRIRDNTLRTLRDVRPRYTVEAARSLHKFEKPVMLAWAPEDRLFPLSLARRLDAIFPNSRIELISDSGTFISEDQPEALIRVITNFVTTRS